MLLTGAVLLALNTFCVSAQQPVQETVERRVPLTESAVALDAKGSPALEGSLRTSAINGSVDDPVGNVQIVIKNVSSLAYGYVSGLVSFYDNGGVRCGEGVFKAEALSSNESVETDAPGLRIRCAAASWRLVASSLVPRTPPPANPASPGTTPANLIISVDGEEHPIQLDKPMTLNFGDKKRTIIVRQSP
jgi:hypothetical protein